ncbi:MAG: hypothetical protein AAF702_32975 [Chloroflexota bacterium]
MMMPMVLVELAEDVIGTDTVWNAGERRPVALDVAARWIQLGAALPVLRRKKRRPATESPEQAVMMDYETPEG